MARVTYVDPMATDEREEKLPPWVREKLTRLRRTVEDVQEQLEVAKLAQAPEGTDTFLDGGGTRRDMVRLPKGALIRYNLGAVEHVEHVDVRVKEEYVGRQRQQVIQVMGGGQIAVKPLSGNLVLIYLES
jgi:hypothetical protein